MLRSITASAAFNDAERTLLGQIFSRVQADPAGTELIPAVLGTAEGRGLSGREAVAAFVAGYEVRSRCTTGPLEQWVMLRPGRR